MPRPASRPSPQRRGVSKRTFYARFAGKDAVFIAVIRRLIQDWLTGFEDSMEQAKTPEEALLTAARRMLAIALTPAAAWPCTPW